MGNNPQAEALVRLFKNNSDIANRKKQPNSYSYKYHHDGPKKDYGGLTISNKDVMPKIWGINNVINKIFQ